MFDCFACSPKVSVGVLEPLLSSEAVHINNTVELEQSMLNIYLQKLVAQFHMICLAQQGL